MKRWTIRGRILGSFAVVLFMMVLMGIVAYSCLIRIEKETRACKKIQYPVCITAHSSSMLWSRTMR